MFPKPRSWERPGGGSSSTITADAPPKDEQKHTPKRKRTHEKHIYEKQYIYAQKGDTPPTVVEAPPPSVVVTPATPRPAPITPAPSPPARLTEENLRKLEEDQAAAAAAAAATSTRWSVITSLYGTGGTARPSAPTRPPQPAFLASKASLQAKSMPLQGTLGIFGPPEKASPSI